MAREIYFRYRDEDATERWNNMYRGMIESGVYRGFSVGVGGSGGWWLKFTHETDPDDATKKIGKLFTRDGTTVHENANQDDVVQGSIAAGLPNIHYVVASYVYNKALPANDVVYAVKEGTSGSPPTPPTLTEDEVLIAEIYVPSGAAGYGSAGVFIRDVEKKSLHDVADKDLFPKFTDVLDPGIYDGMEVIQGSTSLDLTLKAGTWLSQENAKVVESADQTDLFTMTNPGSNQYRLSWVVGMHKLGDASQQDPDYLLVEGTAVALGAEASLPSDGTILTAAQAVDPKYTDASYINKLAYIRLTNVAGTYYIDYIKGETVLDRNTLVVYGAQASSLSRSGKYYGHEGLKTAIDDIYDYIKDKEGADLKTPYTLLLDGVFKMSDVYLTIPSHVELRGLGAPAQIFSDEGTEGVVRCTGFRAIYDSANTTIAQSVWAGSPPSGYVGREFSVQATYQVGEDLVARKFCTGDRVVVVDGSDVYEGWFREYNIGVDNWTIRVWIDDDYNTDGNPVNIDLYVKKHNVGFHNLDIDSVSATGNGRLYLAETQFVTMDKVSVEKLTIDNVTDSEFGSVEVKGAASIDSFNDSALEKLLFSGALTSAQTVGANSYRSVVGHIEFNNAGNTANLTVNFQQSKIGSIVSKGGTSALYVSCVDTEIGKVYSVNKLYIGSSSQGSILGVVVALDDVEIQTSARDVTIVYLNMSVAKTFTNNGGVTCYVLRAENTCDDNKFLGALEYPHSDKNMRLVSDANFQWHATTGILEWDNTFYLDLPWTTGYQSVAAGNATLDTDGDRLYLDFDRTLTGVTPTTCSVRNKASAASDVFTKNRVFIAVRYGDVLYMYDGTRIEDGQNIKIGSTPPPDGSVTYQKYTTASPLSDADPLGYLNQVFRDHASVIENTDEFGWKNDTLFRNTDNATFTYTAATGVIQFSGLSASALVVAEAAHDAGIPLTIMLINTEWQPGTAGKGAYTREAVLDVDDATDTVTIAKGLDVTAGSGSRWNGAIVRGNMVVSNDNLVSFTYTAQGTNRGRITFASNMLFTSYQVVPGYVFVDSSGNKFMILDMDTSGNGAWVDISVGLRSVDTSAPSTKYNGSIRTNDNPYSRSLADLRSVYGGEFIPIDGYAEPDCLQDDQLLRAYHTDAGVVFNFNDWQRRFIAPHDPRVRVWCKPEQRYSNAEEISDAKGYLNVDTQGVWWVEFTGVCTGVALALTGDPTASASMSAYIDGEHAVYSTMNVNGKDCDNTYILEINRYELIACNRLMRLPQGVHHIMFKLPSLQLANLVVRGLYVVNSPLTANKFMDCPGLLVKSGGLVYKEDPVGMQALPTAPTYDKGRRVIRYVNSATTFTWAETQVKTFTDEGDLTATSGTIANVGDASQWRIGDILMAINVTTGTRYLHRITAVGGSSLTILPVAGFTLADAPLYFYGRGYTAMGAGVDLTNYREYEEAAFHAVIQEFAASGPLYTGKGAAGFPGQRKTTVGIRLSDCSTALLASGSSSINVDIGGGILLDVTGAVMRIWFVGTGLSIQRDESVGTCALKVDGLSCGNMVVNTGTPVDYDTDPGGTYICGDLPYGQHVVELTANAGSPSTIVKAITIWQPKKPSFSGFEIVDMNLLGASEATMDIDDHDGTDMNGVDESQFGTINIEAGSFAHPITTNVGVFEDVAGVAADAIIARYHDMAGANLTDLDKVEFAFWGDEITLVTGDITTGTGTIDVYFLDHDGQFRAPSAITGFTVSESYGDTLPTHTTSARRFRWKMDLGFHVLKVQFNSPQVGTTLMQFDSIEVHTPVHNYRTKQPISIDHSMPFCNGGIDKRNLVPLRADVLPKAQTMHIQGAWFHGGGAVALRYQYPFLFYTRGGLVELTVAATVSEGSAGATSVKLAIDGLEDGPGVALASSVTAQIVITRVLYLPAGFHYAFVSTDDLVSDLVEDAMWTVKQIQAIPVTQLASRGANVPMLGPAHLGESSF